MEQRQELLTVEHPDESYDGRKRYTMCRFPWSWRIRHGYRPSGAGKSTFLRCINRLIDASEGSIEFDGARSPA